MLSLEKIAPYIPYHQSRSQFYDKIIHAKNSEKEENRKFPIMVFFRVRYRNLPSALYRFCENNQVTDED